MDAARGSRRASRSGSADLGESSKQTGEEGGGSSSSSVVAGVDLKLGGDASVLVANLVGSDDAVVPTVRSVLERGWGEGFSRSLDEYVLQKEDELRGLCNFHFGEFSKGIEDISQLKRYSSDLRRQISEMDRALQDKGAKVLETSEMLLRFYRIQRHLRVTRQELRRASSCVALVRRARAQMSKRAYFEALQSIDLVREVIHGKDVHRLLSLHEGREPLDVDLGQEGDSRFSLALERWIPRVIDKIKLDVNGALTEWFVTARDRAGDVGARALRLVREGGRAAAVARLRRTSSGATASTSQSKLAAGGSSSPAGRRYVRKESFRTRTSSDALLQWEHRDQARLQGPDIAEICLAAENVSLAPVYQFMDIQKYLGTEEEAIAFYKENRLPQASLQSMMPVDLRKLEKGQFRRHAVLLLQRMTGFLVIEGVVSRSLNLIAPFEIAAIWETMLDTLVPLVRDELRSQGAAKDPTSNLDLIRLLMDMAALLGKSGAKTDGMRGETDASHRTTHMLDASRLVAACYDVRLEVGSSLADACGDTLQSLVADDNYAIFDPQRLDEGDPVRLAGQHLMQLAAETSGNGGGVAAGEPNFSAMVPKACAEVIACMSQAFQLGRQLGGSLVIKDIPGAQHENTMLSTSSSSSSPKSPTSSPKSSKASSIRRVFTSKSSSTGSSGHGAGANGQEASSGVKNGNGHYSERNGTAAVSEGSPRSPKGSGHLEQAAENAAAVIATAATNVGGNEDDAQQSQVDAVSPTVAVHSAVEIACRALLMLYVRAQAVVLDSNTSPEILCQCSSNLEHLDRARALFEAHARQLAKIDGDYSFAGPCDKFADLLRETQPRVVDALRDRVDAIMSSGAVDNWTPQEVPREPHVFVSDAVQYLEVMLAPTSCLRLLPDAQRQVAQFTALIRIADSVLELLTGDEVEAINALSVHQTKLDLDLLKDLASKTDVPAQEVLLTLEQMVDLLRSGNLQEFLRPETRGKRYACLGFKMVKSALRKYEQLATARLSRGDKIPTLKQTDINKVLASN
ncbi:Exocyst complex component 6 [Hondaea fermentalgiana]|uniref:Exocyst complex component 6 n=1 Tax=Hondaea fermentalgiana TaxID=2315210 RepID=A0A2R5G0Q4_9STRA|nr:Exocyst complex component 6 [Hondaea fermentalgiana]|eukprot:GBG24607.1 Exocyst complex component 6 [Hondaea fermentalgiana]